MPGPTDTAVVLGTFDGVHAAHAKLIGETRAKAPEARVVAVTFDRIPGSVLGLDGKSQQIVSCDDKVMLLKRAGADEVRILSFDRSLSETEPEDFFKRIVLDELKACSLAVGYDFRFGNRGRGDVGLLGRLCPEAGVKLLVMGELLKSGVRISSSEIRRRIASGDPCGAADMLGRMHAFRVRLDKGLPVPEKGYVLPPAGLKFRTTLLSALPLGAEMPALDAEAVLAESAGKAWFEETPSPPFDGLCYLAYGPCK